MIEQSAQRGELPRPETEAPDVPPAALWLGYAGLLPFAAGALAAWILPDYRAFALEALVGYAAIILSFMGGCRWGFAAAGMGEGPALLPLGLSVLPALWGWLAALASSMPACLLLAAGFSALLAFDLQLTKERGAPAWWPKLRWPLSAGAVLSLLAAAPA